MLFYVPKHHEKTADSLCTRPLACYFLPQHNQSRTTITAVRQVTFAKAITDMENRLTYIPLSVSRRDHSCLFGDEFDVVAAPTNRMQERLVSSKITVATVWLLSIPRLEIGSESYSSENQHLGSIIGRTPAISCELLEESV